MRRVNGYHSLLWMLFLMMDFSAAATLKNDSRNQIYAAAAYLMTGQPVHYPTLQQNMKAQMISEALSKETGLVDSRPSMLFASSYPENFRATWPMSESYFPSRWVWAHNEFTPRQTMRGKMALCGYLYGLAPNQSPGNRMLTVINKAVDNGSGTVTSQPDGIDCGIDCDEACQQGALVKLTASATNGSVFRGWSGACTGNVPACEVGMDMDRPATATFGPQDPPPSPQDSGGDDEQGSGSGSGGCLLSTLGP